MNNKLDTKKEWSYLNNEIHHNKPQATPYPVYLVQAREFLLDAQNLLSYYENENSENKQSEIALLYNEVIKKYELLKNSVN